MSFLPEGNYTLLFSKDEIENRVTVLAREISAWIEKAQSRSGQQPLVVGVLRGSVHFYSDLVRRLPSSIEMAFCRAWSYKSIDGKTSEGVRVAVDDIEATGRAILMIDDLCDSGSTLLKLNNVFMGLGATEIKTCVCVERKNTDPIFTPQWSGFQIESSGWVLGYGLDDQGQYGNLPDLYIKED